MSVVALFNTQAVKSDILLILREIFVFAFAFIKESFTKYFHVNFAYCYYFRMKCVYGFPRLISGNAMNTALCVYYYGGVKRF